MLLGAAKPSPSPSKRQLIKARVVAENAQHGHQAAAGAILATVGGIQDADEKAGMLVMVRAHESAAVKYFEEAKALGEAADKARR